MPTTTLNISIEPIKEDGYHPFITAKINSTYIRLLLDTGASRTTLDYATISNLQNDLKIIENEILATGLGSTEVVNYTTVIDKLQLGALIIPNFNCALIDLTQVNNSYQLMGLPPIAGVLGSDILVNYKAIINYQSKQLVLEW